MFLVVRGVLVHIEVGEGQLNEEFPVKTCTTCREKLSSSGLLDSLSEIRWRVVNASTYNLTDVDARLHEFITGVRRDVKWAYPDNDALIHLLGSVYILPVVFAYPNCRLQRALSRHHWQDHNQETSSNGCQRDGDRM